MWGELPKLFGKSFAIGFFLPSAAILLAMVGLSAAFDFGDDLTKVLKNQDWAGAAISVFVLWMGGVFLMALNRVIIRFLEGYSRCNPLRVLLPARQRSFARLATARAALEQERDYADLRNVRWSDDRAELRAKLLRQLLDYPDRLDDVLPTRFGNAIRAFEVYPRVVYGLEAINGWLRLIAVIPADYRQAIEDAKAQLDFWVNLWFGAILTTVLYVAFCIAKGKVLFPWIPGVSAAVAVAAILAARPAAAEWGGYVMSAFDLFRGDLCKKLGLKMPATMGEEREMWQLMSYVMTFRYNEAADRLSPFRDTGGGTVPPR